MSQYEFGGSQRLLQTNKKAYDKWGLYFGSRRVANATRTAALSGSGMLNVSIIAEGQVFDSAKMQPWGTFHRLCHVNVIAHQWDMYRMSLGSVSSVFFQTWHGRSSS